MDPLIYFLAVYFPWWAVPSVLILGEMANHYRRTARRIYFVVSALLCVSLIALNVVYFTHGGFENLIPAMQRLEKTYGK